MPLLSVANQAQLKMLFNVYFDMLRLCDTARIKFDTWEAGFGVEGELDPQERADPATFGILNYGVTFYKFAPDHKTPVGVKTMVPWPEFLQTHFDTDVSAMGFDRLRDASVCGGYKTAPNRSTWHTTALFW